METLNNTINLPLQWYCWSSLRSIETTTAHRHKRTDKVKPVFPPSTLLSGGIKRNNPGCSVRLWIQAPLKWDMFCLRKHPFIIWKLTLFLMQHLLLMLTLQLKYNNNSLIAVVLFYYKISQIPWLILHKCGNSALWREEETELNKIEWLTSRGAKNIS